MRKIISRIKKRYLIWAIINIIFIIIFFIINIFSMKIENSQECQHISEGWQSGDIRFAQISCFISKEEAWQKDNVYSFKNTINRALEEAAILNENNETLIVDSYSGEANLNVSYNKKSTEVTAIGVGENFFLFHPQKFLSGYSFSKDDIMKDRIVLDEDTAWQLFGSTDVEGLTVYIGNNPYYIAGVFKIPTNKLEKEAYGEKKRVYLPYESLKKEVDSAVITCYEIILPNPVSNWGYKIIKDNISSENISIIENSNRFSIPVKFNSLKNFGKKVMVKNSVVYPFWENIARVKDEYLLMLFLLQILCLISPVLFIVIIVKNLLLKFKKIKWVQVFEYLGEKLNHLGKFVVNISKKMYNKLKNNKEGKDKWKIKRKKNLH